jgi:hypothetical protein
MKYAIAVVCFVCLSHVAPAADPADAKTKGVHTVADALPKLKKTERNQPPLDARRKAGQVFGQCIAGKPWLHSAAVTFLLSGRERDGQKLADSDCFQEAIAAGRIEADAGSFPVPVMRSLIADGLILIDFRKTGPTDFSATPPLAAASGTGDSAVVAPTPPVADKLGECAARLSPEGVRRLALTTAASDEETSELRQLVPTFAQCLPPGVKLAFAPSVLRDASVLAYARLALTQAASGAKRPNRH